MFQVDIEHALEQARPTQTQFSTALYYRGGIVANRFLSKTLNAVQTSNPDQTFATP